MSVTVETSQLRFAGRGDTGPYTVTFPVTYDDTGNAENLKIYVLETATGTKTDITSTSTVTGLNVYTLVAYSSSYELQILRDPPFTQEDDFTYGSSFPASLFNKALDKLTMLALRLKEVVTISIQRDLLDDLYEDDGVTPVNMILPRRASRKDMALIFDGEGSVTTGAFPSPVASSFMANVISKETSDDAVDALVNSYSAEVIKQDNASDAIEQSGLPDLFMLGKNKIINGCFRLWQRGTSFTVSAAGTNTAYTADRWRVVASGTGASTVISRVAFTPGQVVVEGEPSFYLHSACSHGGDATTGQVHIEQLIENVRTLAGRKAILSFWAKEDNAKSIAIDIVQNFGSGGSPSAGVITFVGKYQMTDTMTKYEIEIDIPSISGKTIGTDGDNTSYLMVRFWLSSGSNYDPYTDNLGIQTSTFLLAQVQLEEGEIATKFEERPIAVEQALCDRYYIHILTAHATTGSAADTSCVFVAPHIRMRVNPTLSVGTTPIFSKFGTGNYVLSNPASTLGANGQLAAQATIATGAGAGVSGYVRDIRVDAEF